MRLGFRHKLAGVGFSLPADFTSWQKAGGGSEIVLLESVRPAGLDCGMTGDSIHQPRRRKDSFGLLCIAVRGQAADGCDVTDAFEQKHQAKCPALAVSRQAAASYPAGRSDTSAHRLLLIGHLGWREEGGKRKMEGRGWCSKGNPGIYLARVLLSIGQTARAYEDMYEAL
jgi:hypothetical protein